MNRTSPTPPRSALFGIFAILLTVSTGTAQAQTVVPGTGTGTIYSSSTTFAQHDQSIIVSASTTGLTTAGTGNPGAFRNQDYLGYNVPNAGTRASGGTFSPSAGGSYPAGWNFSDAMIETGTGTLNGQTKTANLTFTGATTNYDTTAAGSSLKTNTWLKGSTESGGLWNVKAGDSNMLGGFTSAANNNTGKVTINLGTDYTAWGTLIGTQTGSTLGVTIAGYSAVGDVLGSSIFSYELDNITQNTANPYFTGWGGKNTFNTIVITGIQGKSSAAAMPAAYSAYPAGSYISLDQVRVGNAEVPEPSSLLLILAGTGVSLGILRRRRSGAR